MNTIKLNVDMLRAAMLTCKREKIRYVLSGVSIKTNGDINATDGRVLFQGENGIIEGKLEKDLIIPQFKLNKSVKYITLTIDDTIIKVDMFDKHMTITSINLNIIDGIYPDINSMKYSDLDCHIVESKSFGVNPDFLRLATDIFPKSGGLRIEKFKRNYSDTICFIVSSMSDVLTHKQIKELEENDMPLELLSEDWKLLIMHIRDPKYKEDIED